MSEEFRRRMKRWRVREKATIDYLVRARGRAAVPRPQASDRSQSQIAVYQKAGDAGTIHAAFTLSGVSVEEQVRKVWDPVMVGLALF
jgi:hypothetical protein